MKRIFGLTGAGLLLAMIFTVLPARAQDVDQRIQALEDELTRLKTEQAQVKAEQIEMKRSALAAEGALPTFSYRPGNGLLIQAADKAWSIRFSLVAHMRMLFESGESHQGRTNGEVMARRWRPFFNYCINDCFWEMSYGIDADGFGTGNGKNARGTGVGSILQRASVYAHFEQINPWLPTLSFGADAEGAISSYRQGSSSTGSQMEYDILSRNNGFNTGRQGQGLALTWQDESLEGIGIPGRIREFQLVMGGIGEGDDGLSSFRDAGNNFSFHFEMEPFSQVKSKWIQGIGFEVGGWFCNVDRNDLADVACNRLRMQDHGDGGRQTLFDTGENIGAGWTHFFLPGFQYSVGPYRLRIVGGFQRYDGNADTFLGHTMGTNFLIGHDLFLWSPKGWLTGSATTPGSILLGTHFEKNWETCNQGGGRSFGKIGCAGGIGPQQIGTGHAPGGPLLLTPTGGFNQNTVLLREWDIWYFVANRMSIGLHWLWYHADNLPLNSAFNLGVRGKKSLTDNPNQGKGGDWLDMSLNWRYVF
jgi:hypothetical protein